MEFDKFVRNLCPVFPAGPDLGFELTPIATFYLVLVGIQQGGIDLLAHSGQVGEIKVQ